MKLTTKNFVAIALYTALYMAIGMVVMMLVSMLGTYGHGISPGFMALFGGPIIYFMAHKVGKMWQFTIMGVLQCGAFTLLGGAYLPWFITLLTGCIIADFMVSRSNTPKILLLAIANGLMAVGSALGSVIPAIFFMEKFKKDWVARGQTPEAMDETIRCATGTLGFISVVIVFVLGFIGIYLGHLLLKRHFKNI